MQGSKASVQAWLDSHPNNTPLKNTGSKHTFHTAVHLYTCTCINLTQQMLQQEPQQLTAIPWTSIVLATLAGAARTNALAPSCRSSKTQSPPAYRCLWGRALQQGVANDSLVKSSSTVNAHTHLNSRLQKRKTRETNHPRRASTASTKPSVNPTYYRNCSNGSDTTGKMHGLSTSVCGCSQAMLSVQRPTTAAPAQQSLQRPSSTP